jgi:hypothetical protein
MKVHVFVYEHRHGTDLSVHRSEELAIESAAAVAREWWEEACQQDKTLPQRPPSADAEAIRLYFEAQEGFEFHQIRCCELEEGATAQTGVPAEA